MCGENIWRTEARSGKKGSPPRVRGKLVSCCFAEAYGRITPACAGKTAWHYSARALREDHPRVCGENIEAVNESSRNGGSPPRVRGKHEIAREIPEKMRITPACAGKTFFPYATKVFDWDHPRVCGENSRGRFSLWRHRGSPPRVRGKRRTGHGNES